MIIGGRQWMNPVIEVTWETASEINTAGFNLYRRATDNQELIKINPNLIPSSTNPLSGGAYRYRDKSVLPGIDYSYTLEEIQLTGEANRHSPIRVTAERGGKLELTLGLAALTTGIILLTITIRRQRG
jgi:hypothetical protein